MAEPTGNERGRDGGNIAAAARDRGMEQLETAKAQLAEGAERVAAAVERTADELDDGSGEGMSGFGRSAATLMRQLAGGLRERDVEEFARELGTLARRNPGLFLAGSVALGFGIARFFKARSPRGQPDGAWRGDEDWRGGQDWRSGEDWRGAADWRGSEDWRGEDWRGATDKAGTSRPSGEREDFDPDESLDLSASSLDRRGDEDAQGAQAAGGETQATGAESVGRSEDERSPSRSKQGGKQKSKSQRGSTAGAGQRASDAADRPTEGPTSTGSTDSAFAGGTGSGPLRGDKS